jgi:hypothetical protein
MTYDLNAAWDLHREKTCITQSTQRTQRKTSKTGFTGLGEFHRYEGIVSKTSQSDGPDGISSGVWRRSHRE